MNRWLRSSGFVFADVYIEPSLSANMVRVRGCEEERYDHPVTQCFHSLKLSASHAHM